MNEASIESFISSEPLGREKLSSFKSACIGLLQYTIVCVCIRARLYSVTFYIE